MSLLTVYDETGLGLGFFTDEHAQIADRLQSIGALFERWQTAKPLGDDADDAAIIETHKEDVMRIQKRFGFESVDVISVTKDHPQKADIRAKFLSEHTHSDFEVRFFVEGQGLFFLHCEDKVYAILCQQGDLISVPANVKHWFDLGQNPNLKCIRFFTTPDGWIAQYTGSDIATHFPSLEDFLQADL